MFSSFMDVKKNQRKSLIDGEKELGTAGRGEKK